MEIVKRPSKAWYLLPIFLTWLGGLIMFFVIKDEDKQMAKKGLILGFALTAIYVVMYLIIAATTMISLARFYG